MQIRVFDTKAELARAAAEHAAEAIREAIRERAGARVIAATGASQFEFLDALTALPGLEWGRVVCFHLDEYVGLDDAHPASFRRYLRERIVERVRPAAFHFLAGDARDPAAECRRVGALLREAPVDVAFVGIGENGHLAFNDPPADFESEAPYRVVELDEACRRQQLGEGWFATLMDVPSRAISMSIQQMLLSEQLIISVPDRRKAVAVKAAIEGPVIPDYPASILQTHARCTIFLDPPAASLLSPETVAGAVQG